MTLPREQWTPIINSEGEQVGWNTGSDRLVWTTHERFLQAEGLMAVALQAKVRQVLRRQERVVKGMGKGKVAPKQRRQK